MLRILLADDEIAVQNLERAMIRSLGDEYQVADTASNGLEALEKINADPPDILVADIRMPGLNGLRLIEELKQTHPSISMIVVSGYNDFSYVQQALRLGAEDYLLKPVSRKELQECFERIRHRRNDAALSENRIAHISRELESNRRSLYDRIMYDLAVNRIAGAGDENPLSFSLTGGQYAALIVKVDPLSPDEESLSTDDSITQVIIDKYLRYFHQKNIEVRSLCRGSFGYLLVCCPGGTGQLRKECDDLGALIWNAKYQYGLFDLTLGVSSACSRFSGVPDAFGEAEKAMRMRLDFGCGKVIYFEDAPARFSQPSRPFSAQAEGQLKRLLSGDSRQDLETFIVSLFREVSKDGKWRLYDLASAVYASAVSFFREDEGAELACPDASAIRERFENQGSYLRLQGALKEALLDLCDSYLAWQKDRVRRPISQIKEYINLHYMDNITLDELSEHVYLSSAYISSVFKKETGENFNDYLTHVRLDKAKELFRTTNATVKEAAEAVGYRDIRYFSKLFYKTYGVKPKDYKNFVHR